MMIDMPQRFLRPGITHSQRWNAVPFDCQSLYIRILTKVDDYGRYDGRTSVIWGECFAVWNSQNPGSDINPQRVEQMLQRLAADSCGLIDLYEVDGKRVLQVTQWQERVREGAKEKWPKRPNPQESAGKRSVPLPPSSPPSPSPTPSYTPTPSAVAGVCVSAKNQKGDGSDRYQFVQYLKERLGAFYGRGKDDRWSCAEEHELVEISNRPRIKAEMEEVFALFNSMPITDKRFFPRTLISLLEKWTATLDAARRAPACKPQTLAEKTFIEVMKKNSV